jgi:hypothetical protein
MHRFAIAWVAAFGLWSVASAQQPGRSSSSVDLKGGKVTVNYSVPRAQGRGPKDVPVGTAWRMGAGDSTQLRTEVPLMIGDLLVAPGERRLAARHAEEGKWKLVVFTGGTLFNDQLPHEEVPIQFKEESEAQEEMKITLTKEGEKGRFLLRFGTASLSFDFDALSSTKLDADLGGKKAVFEIYGIPSTPMTHGKVAGSAPMTIGQLHVGGASLPIIHQLGEGRQPALTFRNDVKDARTALSSLKQRKETLERRLENAPEDRKEMLERMIKEAGDRIPKLEAQVTAGESLPEKVVVAGKAEPAGSKAEAITASLTPGDAGPVLRLHFGIRAASFTIDPKAFQKAD